jgi:hypothetical protein
MVFKSIRDLLSSASPTWAFAVLARLVVHDHPRAYPVRTVIGLFVPLSVDRLLDRCKPSPGLAVFPVYFADEPEIKTECLLTG